MFIICCNQLFIRLNFYYVFFLLSQAKNHLDQDTLDNYIKPSLDYLLQIRFPGGNFPSSLENDRDRLVQWCHGAPGFIHCLVEASKVIILNNSHEKKT